MDFIILDAVFISCGISIISSQVVSVYLGSCSLCLSPLPMLSELLGLQGPMSFFCALHAH